MHLSSVVRSLSKTEVTNVPFPALIRRLPANSSAAPHKEADDHRHAHYVSCPVLLVT